MLLDDVLSRINSLPPDAASMLAVEVTAATAGKCFIPSPGPQTEAYFSRADVLLYGGQAGGGKSALLNGLALDCHTNSLLMRRRYTDLQGGGGLIDDCLKLYGTRSGFNGSSPPTLRMGDRIITFGAASNLGDEQAFQGRARDFLGIDEAAQFQKSQIQFLLGWVRSSKEGQRRRTVLATNPPLDADGDWIMEMFRPWLDLTHPKPAVAGELRWFVTAPDGSDVEVDSDVPVTLGGRDYQPTSRTFIPAMLRDNPFLANTGYSAQLDALPEPIRSAVRDGNFMLSRQDSDWQVIPTAWIRAAQQRWTQNRPEHAPMSCLGVDIAQGGADKTVLAMRYDSWFAPLESFPGSETPTGPDVAGLVFSHRKNGCTVVLDMGGGYGGSTYDHLKANGIDAVRHLGAEGSVRRTRDQSLGFFNKRAEIYWRFREALDPSQDGGSAIALPDDPELVADLTAPTYDATTGKIRVEPKVDLVKRLGRSPDRGDAVVMAYSAGPMLATHGNQWREYGKGRSSKNVKVNMHRMAARR